MKGIPGASIELLSQTGPALRRTAPGAQIALSGVMRVAPSAIDTAGTEQSILGIFTGIVARNVQNLGEYLKRNLIWLVALSVLWFVLMVVPTYKLPAIGSVLVFLTAAYNGFVAKAMYLGVINAVVIPRVAQVRSDGFAEVAGRYAKTLGTIRQAFGLLGVGSVRVLLLYGGVGIAFSNLLTRNNATDKYLICPMVALWLFDTMSQGTGSVLMRLFRAGFRELTKRAPTFELVYGAFTSFALGLILGFVPGLFGHSYWDFKGYMIGAACIAASVATGLGRRKNARLSA